MKANVCLLIFRLTKGFTDNHYTDSSNDDITLFFYFFNGHLSLIHHYYNAFHESRRRENCFVGES